MACEKPEEGSGKPENGSGKPEEGSGTIHEFPEKLRKKGILSASELDFKFKKSRLHLSIPDSRAATPVLESAVHAVLFLQMQNQNITQPPGFQGNQPDSNWFLEAERQLALEFGFANFLPATNFQRPHLHNNAYNLGPCVIFLLLFLYSRR